MSITALMLLVFGLSGLGFLVGRQRALALVSGDRRLLHSLAGYYGWFTGLSVAVPAVLLMVVWLVVQPVLIAHQVTGMILPGDIADGSSRALVMTDVRRIAEGMDAFAAAGQGEAEIAALAADPAALKTALEGAGVALGAEINPHVAEAALVWRQDVAAGRLWMAVAVLAVAVAGLLIALRRVGPDLRARNLVERGHGRQQQVRQRMGSSQMHHCRRQRHW